MRPLCGNARDTLVQGDDLFVRTYRASAEPRGVRVRAAARSANDVDEHVGRRLRKRRVARGLSQDALAKILGVSFQQLHKYETGENRISVSRLYQLGIVLDAPLDWFFEGLPGKPAEREQPRDHAKALLSELPNAAGAASVLLLRAYQNIDNARLRELLLALAEALSDKGAAGLTRSLR